MIDLADARQVAGAVAIEVFANRRLCRAVTLELGLEGMQRLDVVGLNHWGEIFGAEVKVDRADWKANSDNIARYLTHCDWFWLVTPEGLLHPDEFLIWRREEFHDWRKAIGQIEVAANGNCWVVYQAKRLRPTMAARFEIIWRMAARGNDPGFCPQCGYRASRIEHPNAKQQDEVSDV